MKLYLLRLAVIACGLVFGYVIGQYVIVLIRIAQYLGSKWNLLRLVAKTNLTEYEHELRRAKL